MSRHPRRVATKPRTLWLPRYRSHPPQRLWRLPEPNTFGRICIVLLWMKWDRASLGWSCMRNVSLSSMVMTDQMLTFHKVYIYIYISCILYIYCYIFDVHPFGDLLALFGPSILPFGYPSQWIDNFFWPRQPWHIQWTEYPQINGSLQPLSERLLSNKDWDKSSNIWVNQLLKDIPILSYFLPCFCEYREVS